MSGIATTALRAAKAALRVEIKKRLRSIPPEELYKQSKIITEKNSRSSGIGFIGDLYRKSQEMKEHSRKCTQHCLEFKMQNFDYNYTRTHKEFLKTKECFDIYAPPNNNKTKKKTHCANDVKIETLQEYFGPEPDMFNKQKVLEDARFKSSRRVSIYLCIDEEIRVQTVGILEQIFKQDKCCFVPKFTPNSHLMAMLKLDSLEDYAKLVADNWEIKAPTDEDFQREDATATGGLDLMIVPGLAFTKRGHRLGGGKGYYDVYVQNCSHDPHGRPYTIGLAFKEQILHSIPTDVHDFMVDEIIYPDN